jgi:hypothetical protein
VHGSALNVDPDGRSVLPAQLEAKWVDSTVFFYLEQTLGLFDIFWKNVGE